MRFLKTLLYFIVKSVARNKYKCAFHKILWNKKSCKKKHILNIHIFLGFFLLNFSVYCIDRNTLSEKLNCANVQKKICNIRTQKNKKRETHIERSFCIKLCGGKNTFITKNCWFSWKSVAWHFFIIKFLLSLSNRHIFTIYIYYRIYIEMVKN